MNRLCFNVVLLFVVSPKYNLVDWAFVQICNADDVFKVFEQVFTWIFIIVRCKWYDLINSVKTKIQYFTVGVCRSDDKPPPVVFFQKIWMKDNMSIVVRRSKCMVVEFYNLPLRDYSKQFSKQI